MCRTARWAEARSLSRSFAFPLPTGILPVPASRSCFPHDQQPHLQSAQRDFPLNVKTTQGPPVPTETRRVPNQAVLSETRTWFPQEFGQGFVPTRRRVGSSHSCSRLLLRLQVLVHLRAPEARAQESEGLGQGPPTGWPSDRPPDRSRKSCFTNADNVGIAGP